MKKLFKSCFILFLVSIMLVATACSNDKTTSNKGTNNTSSNAKSQDSNKKVIIYSNADDEVVEIIQKVLNENGYQDKYLFKGMGTSELGGKLLAEGKSIEADLITMSSYYIDSAQKKHNMFLDISMDKKTLVEYPAYQKPTTAQEGSIFVNTERLKELKLPAPTSIKDLADPKYKGEISVADVNSSSTAWLFIQAIVDAYGTDDEGKKILTAIYQNAGNHIESSGSGPIKKVRAGEVAIGFGLRHQAVADEKDGLPIKVIDPIEGNFTLVESVAVINKEDKTNPLAMEMAKCIIDYSREDLMKYYPNALYVGEESNPANASTYPKKFGETLTVDLLKKHVEFSEICKEAAMKGE